MALFYVLRPYQLASTCNIQFWLLDNLLMASHLVHVAILMRGVQNLRSPLSIFIFSQVCTPIRWQDSWLFPTTFISYADSYFSRPYSSIELLNIRYNLFNCGDWSEWNCDKTHLSNLNLYCNLKTTFILWTRGCNTLVQSGGKSTTVIRCTPWFGV